LSSASCTDASTIAERSTFGGVAVAVDVGAVVDVGVEEDRNRIER
jgi:hypothetical protein